MTHDEDLEYYSGDQQIASGHGSVPFRLKLLYFSLPIWGLVWFILYWNGMTGWLDRGYWFELEKAANTTFPITNQNVVTPSDKAAGKTGNAPSLRISPDFYPSQHRGRRWS